jgi:TfoX N-terminal domain
VASAPRVCAFSGHSLTNDGDAARGFAFARGAAWCCSPEALDDDPGVAYDEDLANRIRELIAGEPDVSEQTMFGGLVFLVGGKMSVAAGGQGSLVVRVDPEETDLLLAMPHTRRFEMGGRELPGRIRVVAEGVRTKRQLEPWVRRSVAYARTVPAKR